MSLYCIVYDGEDIVLRDGLLEAAAEQRFVQAVCCCGGQRAEIDAEAFAGVFDPCLLRGPELQEAQRVEPAARRGKGQLLGRADARSQRGADGPPRLKIDADRAAVHGAAHEVPGVAAVEGRAVWHIGLAVPPDPDHGRLRTCLAEQRARQMVGADAAGAVIGSAELLPAGAALRLCRGLPPGKLRSGDGPDVKNGAAHSLTTTGPSGGRRHIPAER